MLRCSSLKEEHNSPTTHLLKFLSAGDYLFLSSVILTLVLISRFNYLLFHSLVEITIISIGFLTFAFTWHLRRFESGYLLIVGILLGFTAFISVFHMLSFKGMGVFGNDANLPTQLWIASRYQLSLFLLLASVFPRTKFDPKILLTTIFICTLALLAFVFSGHFPDCFVMGQGQTDFKINSEYIISIILIISMGLFWINRKSYTAHVSLLIMVFFGFSILTELVFTSYLGVYDLSNMLGHLFQLISSYLLYKAIVETGLVNPFDLMFKNLNEAVKTRDEFISLASHELKTPLTPLKLQLQMFHRELQKKNSTGDEKTLKILSNTTQQLDRLNKLIDGMLDVSQLSTGRFEIFRERVELSTLITDLTKRHENQILSSNSKIELKLRPVELDVDPLRIEQVMTNLLMNAVKYAPGMTIEIGLEKTFDGRVKIWVSDKGPGISKEFQSRIFNRYERGDSTVSVSGLGLGLYISRQIIENHGGTLELQSEINSGSKFIIVI